MPRNPKWTRDELILALDLFFKTNPLHTSEKNPEIVALSNLLNKLPIHAKAETDTNFRNPNGVYMKLCNFLRFEPTYSGVGLKAGSKLDEVIWNEFAGNRAMLEQVACAIKENYEQVEPPQTLEEELSQEDEEFAEGRILSVIHRRRERNRLLIVKKKNEVFKNTGKLACEACNFEYFEKYGEIGKGFTECHHINPVSELSPGGKTKLSELAILCANCHRIIHRTRPWLSVEGLKMILANG